jgi:hypothetical protein
VTFASPPTAAPSEERDADDSHDALRRQEIMTGGRRAPIPARPLKRLARADGGIKGAGGGREQGREASERKEKERGKKMAKKRPRKLKKWPPRRAPLTRLN